MISRRRAIVAFPPLQARRLQGEVVRRSARGLLALGLLLELGCGSDEPERIEQIETTLELRGTASRLSAVGPEDGFASSDNEDFAWRLFALESDAASNLVFSPYSISVTFAMLSAGAQRQTLTEIQSTLGFSNGGSDFHASHNRVLQALDTRNLEGTESTNAQTLRLSNDLWLLPELRPSEPFLDTLSANYGAGVYLTRFDALPEQSRLAINAKVAEDTNQLIRDLLAPGSVTPETLLVLTNAIYFNARWAEEFQPSETERLPFVSAQGESVDTELMHKGDFTVSFQVTDDYAAVSLPYWGGELELVAIMPTAGTFAEFARELRATRVDGIVAGLDAGTVDLLFPKFEIQSDLPLGQDLRALGMQLAFTPEADVGSIGAGVYVSDAVHSATILLDEEGTQAAAATATSAGAGPPSTPVPLHFDHPFVFLIRDVATDLTLFVGQFVVPD